MDDTSKYTREENLMSVSFSFIVHVILEVIS